MSSLLDLSEKIDPQCVDLFATLSDTAGPLDIAFFVVGATARDMIFELGYGLPAKRATYDKDLGVRVFSWGEFGRFKESLLATGLFKEGKAFQRLVYRGELLIDLLPFGGIAGAQGRIRWPPDEAFVMRIMGFQDAYRAALEVRVRTSPPLDILVASIPGLAMMKLISWADRPQERSRDAQDLAFILEHYLDAGNSERLFEKHIDLVEVENFDYARAGARLLGRDIAKIGEPETIGSIRETLVVETADQGPYHLIQAMMPTGGMSDTQSGNRFGELLSLLRELVKGIEDR